MFVDTTFPQGLMPYFTKEVEYIANVNVARSGLEFRKLINLQSNVVYKLYTAIKKSEDIEILQNFFNIMQGKTCSFKLYDETECKIEKCPALIVGKHTVQMQKVVQIGEQILESSYSSGYRIVSLRYFNPVGAHPSALIGELPLGTPNNLVPYLTQVAAGERQSLTVFGDDYDTPDGSCIRDFIHVMDVASAHVKSIEFLKNSPSNKNFFESFNLGTGNGVSVFELINIFEEANSIDLNFSIGPRRPGDVVKVFADPTKIMSQMGWKPGFSLSEAMVHAWNWQKKISKLTL